MDLIQTMKDGASRLAEATGLKDTPPDRRCVEFADRLYRQAQSTLVPLHRQWYEDVLWVLGEHYLEYNASPTLRRFVVRPERSYVPRAVDNLIIDLAERAVSFLVKANVVGRVVPEGVSSDDYQKAVNAERIRNRLWLDDLMEQKLRIADTWCVYTGNAIFLTDLDAVNKPVVEIPKMRTVQVLDPDTGEPMLNPDGTPITQEEPTGEVEKTVPLAEVSSDPVNPMEIIPDPYARNPWELRYWMHHVAVDIDTLADTFGNDAKEVKPDRDITTDTYYQYKIADLVTRASQGSGSYGLSSSVVEAPMENAAIRKTFYRLPCRNYPKGEMLVHAGGKVLHYGPYPFVNAKGTAYRNIHWYGWSLVPGCLWRFGLIRNLKDPQKRLNGMLTQAGLCRKTMGNPQWLVPRGAAFDDEGTSRPGKVNLWTPKAKLRGAEPQQLPGLPGSPDLWREIEVTVAHMDRTSGMNDILRGENPPGVDAGVSLEFLAERASGRFEPAVKEMRQEIKTMEEFRLFLVGRSPAWAMGKYVFLDEDGVAQMVELTNLDAPQDPHIEMEASTPLLWSSAAKKQNVTQLLQAGVIDLTQPQNVRKLKQLYNATEFDDAVGADVRLAEYENKLMVQGQPVKTRPFEDPRIHLPIHVRVTKRPDYYEFPEGARTAIEFHIAMTQDGLSSLMKAQLEASTPDPAEAGPQGAPGGQGGPEQQPAAGGAPPQEGAMP